VARSVPLLTVLVQAATLCLACAPLPAAAQPVTREVLVVLPDDQGVGQGLMKISWRENTNARVNQNLIGLRPRDAPIPRNYFIGIESPNGDSLHLWVFRPNFLRMSSLIDGLVIARMPDLGDCFPTRWFERKRRDYNQASDIPELLSGVILFGHMRSVCKTEGNRQSEALAKGYVEDLYELLADKLKGTFVGRMCAVETACG
jgi:hypothetical protein